MPRKNHRPGKPQAPRRRPEQVIAPPRSLPKPPPIEKTIIPLGRCGRKLRFPATMADEALRQAQALRRSRGQEMHMEKRHYRCDRCGDHHLTSREAYDERKKP